MEEKTINIFGGQVIVLTERLYRKKHHVSYDTVLGMENAFEKEGAKLIPFSANIHRLNNALRKYLHLNVRIPDFMHGIKKDNWYLYICMSLSDLESNISVLRKISKKTKHLLIYCFDTWESQYSMWTGAFDEIQPYCIFFAYKNSYIYFKDRYRRTGFVPQSMDEHYFYPHKIKRDRLFMQMGRKNIKIHSMIMNYLADNDIQDCDNNYVYERTKGVVIYPDTEELAKNISRSFFFVCAPQSLENSKLTGNVSDVTARFYEAMACKTMIIGFKPDTYDELFPEDSMIELKQDGSDFNQKIESLLNNAEEYEKKVDENYQYLKKYHRWKNRFESMVEIINAYELKVDSKMN